MEKFWMMVLAVIVGFLLMRLVVNPIMNMFGVKEGMNQGPGGSVINYSAGFGSSSSPIFNKEPKCNNEAECAIKNGEMKVVDQVINRLISKK